MDSHIPSTSKNETLALRERIRARYHTDHQADPDRYPALELNTNRDNYAPLVDSFEDEFYRRRGYDRKTTTIKIPSTNTLARLFTEDDYLPITKILNTCNSYAEGVTQVPPQSSAAILNQPVTQERKQTALWWGGALVGLLVVGGLALGGAYWLRPTPGGLLITSPKTSSTVPRSCVIEGKVNDAEAVWLVVRSTANNFCWVQAPAHVSAPGEWVGVAYLGRDTTLDDGYRYQIRAFVNPATEWRVGDMHTDWPKAELASEPITVIRGKSRP